MTQWIVFDAMGVIFEEGDDILKRLVPFLRKRGSVMEGEIVHSIYRRASLGQLSCREFWDQIGMEAEYPAIENEYLEKCLTLDPQFIGIAERLSGRFSMAVLSNDIQEWSEHLRRTHNLDRFFRAAVISSEVGVRKPAPEIYRILLDRLQADGKDCIFIDDRISNLTPAAALGMIPVWMAKGDDPQAQEFTLRIRKLSELPALILKLFP
jgi:HAD superfamily hydrolase (TIGR01509 family)